MVNWPSSELFQDRQFAWRLLMAIRISTHLARMSQ